jgi:hypothetical protein
MVFVFALCSSSILVPTSGLGLVKKSTNNPVTGVILNDVHVAIFAWSNVRVFDQILLGNS